MYYWRNKQFTIRLQQVHEQCFFLPLKVDHSNHSYVINDFNMSSVLFLTRAFVTLSLLTLLLFSLLLFLARSRMGNGSCPKLPKLRHNAQNCSFRLQQVSLRSQNTFVIRSQFLFLDSIGQLEVSLGLLISLQNIHAATNVIVDCSCVHSVSTEAVLSNLSCLQVAAQSPSRLIDVEENRAKTAIGKSLIRMVICKFNVKSAHVAAHRNIILTSRFVDAAQRQLKVQFLFGTQMGFCCS